MGEELQETFVERCGGEFHGRSRGDGRGPRGRLRLRSKVRKVGKDLLKTYGREVRG